MPGCSARSAVIICIFANKSGTIQFNIALYNYCLPHDLSAPSWLYLFAWGLHPRQPMLARRWKKELERNQIWMKEASEENISNVFQYLKNMLRAWNHALKGVKRQTFINPYLGNRIKGRVCLGEETWRRGGWWLQILAEISVIMGVTLWSGPERECVDGGQMCGRVTVSCTWGVGGTADDFARTAGNWGWSSWPRSGTTRTALGVRVGPFSEGGEASPAAESMGTGKPQLTESGRAIVHPGEGHSRTRGEHCLPLGLLTSDEKRQKTPLASTECFHHDRKSSQ